MELSGSSILKNVLFFLFSKESFSYISGNGNPKNIPYISGRKLLIFQEVTFRARKTKKSAL